MDKTDKYLDELSKEVFKNASIDRPSIDFTASVMSQISKLETSTTTYKPLISTKGWLLTALSTVLFIVCIGLSSGSINTSSWFESIDLSNILNIDLVGKLPSLSLSNTFIYAVVLFGVMFAIQVPFLKNYFNAQLKV
ncbi:hypothetical protein [Seonamhaeicola marinus]|uniref:Uncharacterized protein n=1 Tax=Seonamhaeicola marinus TaxID=1912246 RepID=A0A5D0HJC0_9FLAO|nr:hypothetical protein [Seonamhaeicola marinus]TYA71355.1 hypothetical protein FUA24_17380 [Seonamhaeicola marinus]